MVKPVSDFDLIRSISFVWLGQLVLLGVYSGMPLSDSILELGSGSLQDKLVHSCSHREGFWQWLW